MKFRQNPQGHRTILNEVLASTILRVLGLRTPRFSFIEASEHFLRLLRHLEFSEALRRLPIKPGLHFASQITVDPVKHAIYDYLPTPLLPKVANLSDFTGMLVADKWLANRDTRQAVFFRERQFVAEMIDHGMALGGGSWNIDDYPMAGAYFDPAVYDGVRSFEDLEQVIISIEQYPENLLCDAVAQLPPEWVDNDRSELEALVDRLAQKRRKVRYIMEDFVSLHGCKVFRRWVQGKAN